MSEPTSPIAGPRAEVTPIGVRVAGTISVLLGILTVVFTLSMRLPLDSDNPQELILLGIGACVGGGAIAAGALLWRRQKVGVLVLVLAWALQAGTLVAFGAEAQGNPLITIALVLAALNWKYLR